MDSGAGVVFVDADDRLEQWTDRAATLFGIDDDRSAVDRFHSLLTSESQPVYLEALEEVTAPNSPSARRLQCTARRPDGSTFEAAIGLDVVDIDGTQLVIVSVRPEGEGYYAELFETLPDGVFIVDGESQQIIDVNPAGLELMEYDRETLIGKPNSFLHPDGERYREGLKEAMAGMDGGTIRQFPDGSNMYVETSSGMHVPIEMSVNYTTVAGRPIAIGIFHDISPRIERERADFALREAVQDLITIGTPERLYERVATDLRDIFTYETVVVRAVENGRLNPVAVAGNDSLEGEPRSFPLGESNPAGRAFTEGTTQTVAGAWALECGEDPDDDERYSGTYLPFGSYGVVTVLGAVNPYGGTEDLVRSLLACAEATLDRIHNERRLKAQNERLDRFAGIVSHDLRNPLSIASGHVELLEEDLGGHDSLEEIEYALTRIDELVTDVLEIAREGNDDRDVESVTLEAVARAAWSLVDTADATLAVETTASIRANRVRLQQLFENLFRNAVEHAGSDVEVCVGGLEDGFYLEDDGPGISPDERDSVLTVGYSGADGTGFGLAIVESIVDEHGWTVTVGDGRDGGARFAFRQVEIVDRVDATV